MAKSSSSKKIQRAARAASASRGSKERRELGFPIILVVVLILGTTMVVMSRNSRAPALPPKIGDHWHAAYGIYDCDHFVGFFTSSADPDGIHSHNDGVIHIHPWNSSATGEDARFDVFFEAMGARVTADEISGPGVGVLEAGNDCGGETTVIRAARFIPTVDVLDSEVPLSEQYILDEEFLGDFSDVQLKADLEAFTIARVPADAEIPMPPEDRLLSSFVSSGAGLLQSTGPSTDVDPGEVSPGDADLGEFLPEDTDMVVELPADAADTDDAEATTDSTGATTDNTDTDSTGATDETADTDTGNGEAPTGDTDADETDSAEPGAASTEDASTGGADADTDEPPVGDG